MTRPVADSRGPRRDPWRYPVATIVTGVLWYCSMLLGPVSVSHGLFGEHPVLTFLSFPLTSLILGLVTWPIYRRGDWLTAVLLAAVMAFPGAIMCVWFCYVAKFASRILEARSLYLLELSDGAIYAAISSFTLIRAYWFVLVPTAIAVGLVHHWAASEPEGDSADATPAPGPRAR